MIISFLYRYGFVSILSFFLSNLLYFIFENNLDPIYASFFSLFLILNINIFFFFKLKIFRTNKSNYLKIIFISTSFRMLEFLLFNFFNLYLFKDIKSNYIFLGTLVLTFFIKSIIFYINSDIKKLHDIKKIKIIYKN